MPNEDRSRHPDLLPSIAIVVGGMMWGLFWIPIHAIGRLGLTGAWPGALIYAACVTLLLPLLIMRRRQIGRQFRQLVWCGLLTGAAFSLYATSLFLTDVVRVILLFYLTPVWGTLLGMFVLGERLTVPRVVALVSGLLGLLVVLGIGANFPLPQSLGDWLALASGMIWAYGSLRLYQMDGVGVSDQVLSFIGGSLLVSSLTVVIGGELFSGLQHDGVLQAAVPLAFLAALFVIPMLFLTLWPATVLTPARVGLLLMSEVVVGVGSAALYSGAEFGRREIIGTLLIVAAGFIEVMWRPKTKPGSG